MTKRKAERRLQVEAQDEREARVMEAARTAYRLAKEKLHEARDPASSKEVYEAVWEASDGIGKAMLESVEEEEAEEDPDLFIDERGVRWKAVTEDARTLHTRRGPIRVKRKRHRAVRNGVTRCFFEERRGVMSRGTMPDLGEAILRTYANAPRDEAARLLTTLTGHAISPSRVKRFVVDESTVPPGQEEEMFDACLAQPEVPPEAQTLVISVDALSLGLRK
ncbi:MAG: hypothetical protein AAF447_06665 [Myxococcota bacterium]